MSDKQIIFEAATGHGEVGRHGDDYYTVGAGHAMCVEMAKEIERLRRIESEIEGRIAEARRQARDQVIKAMRNTAVN